MGWLFAAKMGLDELEQRAPRGAVALLSADLLLALCGPDQRAQARQVAVRKRLRPARRGAIVGHQLEPPALSLVQAQRLACRPERMRVERRAQRLGVDAAHQLADE